MEKKYKAIYKCRLCGKEFETEASVICEGDFPTASVIRHHECEEGRYGAADLQGTYEVLG